MFTQLRREERRGEEIIEHKMHIDMDLFIEKDKKQMTPIVIHYCVVVFEVEVNLLIK